MVRIERIEAWVQDQEPDQTDAMRALQAREVIEGDDFLSKAQLAINQAKLAEFGQYDRHRYTNPFRYDTERDVFEKLEQLRGISRKQQALTLAIAGLEDHASDLQRRRQQIAAQAQKRMDDAAARRGMWLNFLLGMTGIFGAGQMFYWVGEKVVEGKRAAPPRFGEVILSMTEFTMTLALAVFVVMLAKVVWDATPQLIAMLSRRKPAETAAED